MDLIKNIPARVAGGLILFMGVLCWVCAPSLVAHADEPRPHLLFQCAWTDAYDSALYVDQFQPGMALIAAPNSDLTLTLGVGGNIGETRSIEVLGITLPSFFSQNGGRVNRRQNTAEYVLALPDIGGSYPFLFTYRSLPSKIVDTAMLFVLIPKTMKITKGRINGYMMGQYPRPQEDKMAPGRFVEVTPDLMDKHLSTLFQIRDFVSNARSAEQKLFFPKYAVICYSLIRKVEKLVKLIDQSPSYQCKGIRVLSGFRTPDYNRSVPEAAFHSYHQYGLAADIIVDSAPADGQFDDVNQDGKVNLNDVGALAQICDYLEDAGALAGGGIGIYEYRHSTGRGKYYSTYHVHIDVRQGKSTRWGYAFKDGRKFARILWKNPPEKKSQKKI